MEGGRGGNEQTKKENQSKNDEELYERKEVKGRKSERACRRQYN